MGNLCAIMYQAGIKNITLYENVGIEFYHWNYLDDYDITSITSLGTAIQLTNENRPVFDIKMKLTDGGETGMVYDLSFILSGLIQGNFDTITRLNRSIYGWCFLVEFYDGTYKFYNTPLFTKTEEIKPHEEMTYEIKLMNPVATISRAFDYTPGISTVPVYRADTTILTADTTIYTADYAL